MNLHPLRMVGNAIDSLIGVVSPQRALANQQLRSAMYAAAQSPRTTGGWSPVDSTINDLIANSALPIRARIRQLVRDFPYFSRAVNIIQDYVVGSGIIYQAAIRTPDGKFDRVKIQQAEDAWNFWADEADAAGRLHLYEMIAVAKRQECETGEYLIVARQLRDRKRYLPLALQMYESDWLTTYGANIATGNDIHQGVEFDTSTGRTIAYHFTDPDGWGKTVRIPAESVIHGYRTMRPGQLRGISDFTAGVLLAKDLSTYMDAEIDGAKMAAKWLAFVKTPDVLGRQLGTTTDADGKKIDTIENAIIEYLRPGEDMQLASNPRPGSNFPPMVKLILTMLSVSTGVPYELLSGNYEGMNYSVGKMVRNDFAQMLRPMSMRHIRGCCEPIKRHFLESAVLAGRMPWRDYFSNPAPYHRATWQPPGMESIDIARETKSMIDQVKSGLRSPQEIAAARGRDLEDIYREIKEAKDLAEEIGIDLDLSNISTALANNPAAIVEQDGKGVTQ